MNLATFQALQQRVTNLEALVNQLDGALVSAQQLINDASNTATTAAANAQILVEKSLARTYGGELSVVAE